MSLFIIFYNSNHTKSTSSRIRFVAQKRVDPTVKNVKNTCMTYLIAVEPLRNEVIPSDDYKRNVHLIDPSLDRCTILRALMTYLTLSGAPG
jgi:hypothetical protein